MFTTALVDTSARWLERLTSRRTFLQRVAVVGSALSVSGLDFVLRPGTAYASVCGSGSTCASGWTALCCTINHGVNQCPPGSFAGGWWKADGASLCGGQARYYVDCHPRCECGCGGGRHFCSEGCWPCRPHCASGTCDQRRVCHNVFRYGQCHREIRCTGPVWCRVISCTPPWKWASCSSASATDNFTVSHNAPCNATSWTLLQSRYRSMGSQGSILGTNIGPERAGHLGSWQRFAHGRMYHGTTAGTHYTVGAITSRYVAIGESASFLGLPTTDTRGNPDGQGKHNNFQHGAIYWSASTGAHAVHSSVLAEWSAHHGVTGPLGYPTWDSHPEATGSALVGWFQHGGISVSSVGSFTLLNPIWPKWRHAGGPTTPLGYPTSDSVTNADHVGAHADFQHGAIYTSPTTGTHAVWGPIFDYWNENGRETGSLGYPTSDIYAFDADHDRCDFTGGTLDLDKTTGQVTQVK